MGWLNALLERFVPRAAKSWPLDNAIQAQALSGILAEEKIPHKVLRNGEALLAYVDQSQSRWGRLETEEAYYGQVEQLYQDFLKSEAGEPEDTEAVRPS